MGSIKDRVAIVGMGCIRFGEHFNKGSDDMIIEAAEEAFQDAGIDRNAIQAAWVGTVWSGVHGLCLSDPLKLKFIPVTRVENACATGSDAFRNACYGVAAGIYDTVLVLGFEKAKDTGYSGNPAVTTMNTNRSQSQTGAGHFALLATGYFAKYGLSPADGKRMIGQISVKSHHNGAMNPKCHFQREITLDQVLNAPVIAWPLGLFDCCGVSDGAAAAVITRADLAKNFRPDPIYVKALQVCCGHRAGFLRQDYDWTQVVETQKAGEAAYQEAGVTNPREEISMAEVHDCFSITEATIMEDLSFSPRGKVKEDIESGFFELGGQLPVQPDGGLKCFGHPVGASGIRMLYEMYKQLQGKADKPERQIKDPKLGLTHNQGGYPAGPAVSVIIVGR